MQMPLMRPDMDHTVLPANNTISDTLLLRYGVSQLTKCMFISFALFRPALFLTQQTVIVLIHGSHGKCQTVATTTNTTKAINASRK